MSKKIIIYTILTVFLNACSKGSDNNAQTPGATTTQTEHRIFVTLKDYTGNLGGLAGADSHCSDEAKAAGFSGTFKAFLVDEKNMAKLTDRFTSDDLPVNTYYSDNTVSLIANTFKELLSSSDITFLNPILDAKGQLIYTGAWTGLQTDGTNNGSPSCKNWTSGQGADTGRVGSVGSTNDTVVKVADNPCDKSARLYCIN